MEEGEAAAIGRLDTAAQVVPALDLVDRLVADDPLQDVGRRRPIDRADNQEAAIEPGAEQVREVVVDLAQFRLLAAMLDQILAHRHQRRRSARRQVEPPEQLLPGRLHRLQQALQVDGRGLLAIVVPGAADGYEVGVEGMREQPEELDPRRHRLAGIAIEQLPGQGHSRCLSPARQQGSGERLERLRRLGSGRLLRPAGRTLEQGPAPLGNAAEHVVKEARVHLSTSFRHSTTNSSQTTTGATTVTSAP